jgi:plasmid stabilization system protein ParE
MPTHHRIIVPSPVRVALQKQADFIAENATRPVALKWLSGIIAAISSPAEFPERFSLAPENEYLGQELGAEIRHLIYKKSFRVIFAVKKNEVRILKVKHSAQQI